MAPIVGISHSQLDKIEKGQNQPNARTFYKLSKIIPELEKLNKEVSQ
jgi:transcriptional regulator with XRE-family HTH domain